MSRMSGARRKKIYEFLRRRDGEYCFIGGEPGSEDTLLVDHADNNSANNKQSNLHLICRTMNSAKNPRSYQKRKQSSAYVGVSNEMAGSEVVSVSAELRKNQQSEPDFRHWLFIEIWRKGRLPFLDVINSGAAVARSSQSAIRRYLDKESSRVRIYQIIEDPATKERFVQFGPYWERCRKLEENRMKVLQQARNLVKGEGQDLVDKKKGQGTRKGSENDRQPSSESSQNSQRPS